MENQSSDRMRKLAYLAMMGATLINPNKTILLEQVQRFVFR